MKKLSIILIVILFSFSGFSQVPWSITGNSNATASNFIGTTNNIPLTFKVNNAIVGYTGYSSNSNVTFGYQTINPSIGWGNTAFGNATLRSNSSGVGNTGVGTASLNQNTNGHYNTAIGINTLAANVSGAYNTAIGYYADISSSGLINATAIGNGAIATSNNQIKLGNSSVTSIGGKVSWTIISDGRVKSNIRQDVPGLDFIELLQPITYNVDPDVIDELLKVKKSTNGVDDPETLSIQAKNRAMQKKVIHTGFIAQDVEKAAQTLGYEFSGVDVPENDNSLYGLRYAEFVVPLVKAVQELNDKNSNIENENVELKAQISNLQSQIDELKQLMAGKTITGIDSGLKAPGALLEQNIPNPFNQSTTINYTLPDVYSNAQIVITDSMGKTLKQIPISNSGSIEVETNFMDTGIYFYSLQVDGKLINTKKMVKK